ncbi:M48 family metallopeptidase [Butyribacter intestini]|jgi:predicted metal-dependent hydrolase|uniref:Metal-dependent hydrolase n=1 Tax=Butyribacter intestini TaxID=1703332 RepID=A0AAW3JT77_9FIRM|nr:SprT family zinc-dependent metalloprotease [Butyribacter intestini]KQC86087.1 metal-dependent hydrolase [Butyribacter intestini]RHU77191.1 M48 family peptidase [Butyribacter intestini]
MDLDDKTHIEVIRSKRKTLAIEIRPDMRVVVRAPEKIPQNEIMKFVEEKQNWIKKHLVQMYFKAEEIKKQKKEPALTNADIEKLCQKALSVIPDKVKYYAEIMGVTYGRITIRNQKTRWGSCSSKGNLNFNCLLMLMPDKVLDYVVVHELCHLKQMNHSKKFWKEVERYMPDYKNYKKWLNENGGALIERMLRR